MVGPADVQTWLTQVILWQSDNTDSLSSKLEKLEDLQHFLTDLHSRLQACVNTESALSQLPQVGQLLGRLCGIPWILADKDTYIVLMKCILWFNTDDHTSPVAVKAASWAMSQVRSSLCHSYRHFTSRVLDLTGFAQTDFNKAYLSKYVSCLGKLDFDPKKCMAEKLCLSALNVTHLETMKPVFEQSLLHHTNTTNISHENICKKLKIKQDVDKETYTPSYEAQLLLWQGYRSSVEQDSLSMLQLLTTMPARHQVVSLLESNHMVKACATNSDIYSCVLGVTRAVLMEVGTENDMVWRACGWLHDVVLSYINSNLDQHCISIVSCTPREYHGAVSIMQHLPYAMSRKSCQNQIGQLSKVLPIDQSSVKEGGDTVREEMKTGTVMIQALYQSWYAAAVLLVLTGDRQGLEGCYEVMFFFISDSTVINKIELEDIIMSLRALMSKATLKVSDLLCAIPAYLFSALDVQSVLLRQLLSAFLFCSRGGVTIIDEILEILVPDGTAGHLSSVLETLDVFLPFLQSWQLLSDVQVQAQYNYIRRTTDSLTNEGLDEHVTCLKINAQNILQILEVKFNISS